MNNDITLENLIEALTSRIPNIKYKPSPPGCFGFSYYYYDDTDAYQKWLATAKRFLSLKYPNDKYLREFEDVSKHDLTPEQQNELLAILEAFAVLPEVATSSSPKQKGKSLAQKDINITTTINNTNSQSQTQEQTLAVDIFLEAIKDDLTGRQIKELKAIVAEANNDLAKARPGIVDKIKSFGVDVASNIVANILTNPTIWSGLF